MRAPEETLPDLSMKTIQAALQTTARHYAANNAPAWFMDWLDDLSVRTYDAWEDVKLGEIATLFSLRVSLDEWKPTPVAVNLVYKFFDRVGRDTSGILGY